MFLPGESHGQSSLVGYNPQGRKELDMTERLSFPFLSYSLTKIGVDLDHQGFFRNQLLNEHASMSLILTISSNHTEEACPQSYNKTENT